MTYFYVDVSTEASMPMSDRDSSVVLGKRGITGSSYTVTAAEWKVMRKLAAAAGGRIYWRVRAQDHEKAFTTGSATVEAGIDPGTWGTVTLDLSAEPAAASWEHSGEGYALYSLEFSVSAEFEPGARTMLVVPSRPVAASTYALTPTEVKRLQTFAARAGKASLYWRVRAQDAQKAFTTRSAAQTVSVP